jgi:hypothetical protein
LKIILEIPLDAYTLCLTKFKLRSPEYLLLRNGVIVRDDQGAQLVQILCDVDKVPAILAMIDDVCPEFSDQVRQRPDIS